MNRIVVTGSNRGLGLGIVKNLVSRKEPSSFTDVTLACRDISKAENAILELKNSPDFNLSVQLDSCELDLHKYATNSQNLKKLFDYSQINVFYQNAAIQIEKDQKITDRHQIVQQTLQTNFFGTVNLSEDLIEQDIIEPRGKLLFMSSSFANPAIIKNQAVKQLVTSQDCSLAQLRQLGEELIELSKQQKDLEWFRPSAMLPIYLFSKILLNKYIQILSKKAQIVDREIFVCGIHPGWVRTAMGGDMAPLSIEQGIVNSMLMINQKEFNADLHGKLFVK